MSIKQAFKYQVSLSFAGEQRAYVERVARSLKGFGVNCFYDSDETAQLWGANGIEALDTIYGAQSRYVIMFISNEYLAKPWCRVERRAALAGRLERDADSVLQVAFDLLKVPGMPSTEMYVEARNYEPEELAVLICKKLGVDLTTQKASSLAPPFNPETAGTVRCLYGSHGGRFTIGSGDWSFDLHFSRASNESIHLYNNTPTIRGIALAKDCHEVADVADAGAYDFSSPNLSPCNGALMIIENHLGFYALVRIEYIADESRGSERDEVIFSYRILRNRGKDFREEKSFPPLAPSIALEFDVANGTLAIRNTFNEPIKWYLTSTDTSGLPPAFRSEYREQPATGITPGKSMSPLRCDFGMAPMPGRTKRVNYLHMDIYISDSIDNFYRVRFLLKMTCRGKPTGEAVLVDIKSQLEGADYLES